jgi:hypothetical protein
VLRFYLTPFFPDFDVDILYARAHFTVIERAAMKIFAAKLTKLISPLGIAVMSEYWRNEKQDR